MPLEFRRSAGQLEQTVPEVEPACDCIKTSAPRGAACWRWNAATRMLAPGIKTCGVRIEPSVLLRFWIRRSRLFHIRPVSNGPPDLSQHQIRIYRLSNKREGSDSSSARFMCRKVLPRNDDVIKRVIRMAILQPINQTQPVQRLADVFTPQIDVHEH